MPVQTRSQSRKINESIALKSDVKADANVKTLEEKKIEFVNDMKFLLKKFESEISSVGRAIAVTEVYKYTNANLPPIINIINNNHVVVTYLKAISLMREIENGEHDDLCPNLISELYNELKKASEFTANYIENVLTHYVPFGEHNVKNLATARQTIANSHVGHVSCEPIKICVANKPAEKICVADKPAENICVANIPRTRRSTRNIEKVNYAGMA